MNYSIVKTAQGNEGYTLSKAYPYDAGYDIKLPDNITLNPFETTKIALGLSVEVPKGYCGMLVPRSSIAITGLNVATSVIDSDYAGQIHLIATNCTSNIKQYKRGDRICSLIILKICSEELVQQSQISSEFRHDKGFGSSNK